MNRQGSGFNTNMNTQNNSYNYQMCVLSVIGICFVVFGHISNDPNSIGTFYGWFPYYSFHMPLFIFISGYFFKDPPKKNFAGSFFRFLLKKIKFLILPYYIINGIFILIQLFLNDHGFDLYGVYTLKNWLLSPWTEPQQITFAIPAWFVIALFIAEIYYILLRKIAVTLIRNDITREIVLLGLTLILGLAAFYYKNHFEPSNTIIVYLRSVVFLFFLQVGFIYRNHLEKLDHLPSLWYFLILFVLQFIMIILTRNGPMSPSLYNLSGFGNSGISFFILSLTGTFLWLRIARLLSFAAERSRFIRFIGRNTKYIMFLHLFGFFLLNLLFSCIYKSEFAEPYLRKFNLARFHYSEYYVCTVNPRLIILYFIAGMLFSLLVAWIISLVSQKLRKIRKV